MHPLTDAFIKGRAKFKKKAVGHYFEPWIGKPAKAACHMGAIWYGVHKNTDWGFGELAADFPELLNQVPIPCGCDLVPDKVGEIRSLLIHLSDEHDGRSGWSDENVATWLEKVLTA